MTKQQLERFIRKRNADPCFASNMQFWIDADDCGFDVKELGKAEKLREFVYQWRTPYGLLTEEGGVLRLEPLPA